MDQNKSQHISIELPYYDRKSLQEIEGQDLEVIFAKYANDAEAFKNSIHKNNAKITLDDDDNVCIIATKNIKSASEIFCSYGKKYWKKHQ